MLRKLRPLDSNAVSKFPLPSPVSHELFMKRCLTLAQQALQAGDHPFGSVIVKDGKIIAEARNRITANDVTNHAEIQAMRKAQNILKTSNLSDCTIYSNCEPCPMCAFMIRELKFKEVVFALLSPDMGGYSRWNILGDVGLMKYEAVFSTPPNVIIGILENEALEQFEKAGWTIAALSAHENGSPAPCIKKRLTKPPPEPRMHHKGC